MSSRFPKLFVFLAVCAGGLVAPVFAAPQIDVGFQADAAEAQQLVHATAEFPAGSAAVQRIFESISAYPGLHDWIRSTTRIAATADAEEYRVEFAFPWPVGRQWSRVEVRREGNALVWKQLEGSIRANHGRISFTPSGESVRIDYLAAIDIGLPELWTRSYKARFVREFLGAACEQAVAMVSRPALALADEH